MELLSSKYFQFFTIPLLTTLLSVFVRIVSRNDKFSIVKKEDFAIGLEIFVTAILLLASDTLKYVSNREAVPEVLLQNRLFVVPWIMLGLLIGLWSISTLIRKLGWKNGENMNWWWGIICPNIFGLITLILVVNWINN